MKIKFSENSAVYDLSQEPNVVADRIQVSVIDTYDVSDIYNQSKTATQIFIVDDEGNLLSTYAGLLFFALSVVADSGIYSLEFNRSKEMQDLQEQMHTFSQVQTAQGNSINELSSQIEDITPYTANKTAYIDDEEVVFTGVPNGALLVSFSNGNTEYSIERDGDTLIVNFAPLSEVTEISIAVQ